MSKSSFVPKRCSLPRQPPLPTLKFDESCNERYVFTTFQCNGTFNGFNIVIEDPEDMIAIYTKGYFGKGSLSQGYPSYSNKFKKNLQNDEILEKQSEIESTSQYEILSGPSEVQSKNTSSEMLHACEDTKEELHLSLEESFFLSYALNCLHIYSNNEQLDHSTMWATFQKAQPKFVERYVAYHYYRAKGWVVRSGIKYGGDYVLYKDGPPFYHANFVVFVISNTEAENVDINFYLACHRAVEVTKKELLICQVTIPENYEVTDLTILKKLQVSEYTLKRWLPSVNRNTKT